MAKGAFLSVKRGKLGDSVGYNITNSNSKERQGWRIYQPVVSNPQTDGQIDQRLKLTAVNNLYRALKEVIQRGQENTEYGDPARRAWLKRALSAATNVPVLQKGSTTAAPIEGCPIMYGSLPDLMVSFASSQSLFTLQGTVVNSGSNLDTIGGISQILIDSGYKAGDQLTIVYGFVNPEITRSGFGVDVRWNVLSFILDVTDTRQLEDVFGSLRFTELGDVLAFDYLPGIYNLSLTAVAVSISRDGDNSHLRSTASLVLGDDMYEGFYGITPAERQARRASYRKKTAASEDWEQVPTRGADGVTTYTITAADGTTFEAASVSFTDNYAVVVSTTGEEYFIKCLDVRNTAYNMWLTARSGDLLSDMWSGTAPSGGTPSDAHCGLYTGNDATTAQLQLLYFLMSQGFDARGLFGQLPQS